MAVELHLQDLLSDATRAPAVTTLVGAAADARVYYMKIPQATAYPCIVLQIISSPRTQHLRGPDGWKHTRVQVDCIGKKYGDAAGLVKAVENLLDGYKGFRKATRIGSTILQNERDGQSETPGIFIKSLDFLIWNTDGSDPAP